MRFLLPWRVPMRVVRQALGLLLIVLTIPAGSFAAQSHIVDPGQLATSVTQHTVTQDADRAAIRDALARPEVRDVATKVGVDMTRMTGAVNTLSGSDLERAAAAAR